MNEMIDEYLNDVLSFTRHSVGKFLSGALM